MDAGVAPLDLFEVAQLRFECPDFDRYPCLRLAMESMSAGGGATTVLNAANEVVVDAFLRGKIGYLQIAQLIESALEQVSLEETTTLQQIVEKDHEARRFVLEQIGGAA